MPPNSVSNAFTSVAVQMEASSLLPIHQCSSKYNCKDAIVRGSTLPLGVHVVYTDGSFRASKQDGCLVSGEL